MEALKSQLTSELTRLDNNVETIFIGGGTPSTIEAKYYKEILNIVSKYIDKDIEITIEANPNSATKKWLEDIYDIGINRISFGVQSFDDEKLSFLGRNHNKTQAIEAIKNASEVGFRHINCDIIYDTTLDTKELLLNDLNIIKDLPVDHVSAYSLTIEEGTKFYDRSVTKIENEENGLFLFEELEKLGFKQYEISNFALNDEARSKHNLGYWEYKEYLGVGSGAVGCIGGIRLYNENDVEKYIQNPLEYVETEELSKEDVIIENVLLGFRSAVGIDLSILNDNQLNNLKELEKLDKIFIKENRAFAKDYLLADELALFVDS